MLRTRSFSCVRLWLILAVGVQPIVCAGALMEAYALPKAHAADAATFAMSFSGQPRKPGNCHWSSFGLYCWEVFLVEMHIASGD